MAQHATALIEQLQIRLYADGADLAQMREMTQYPFVKGFTTNPSFMRLCGVDDYEAFARAALEALPQYPISLEVFADDFADMEAQALTIASWGANANIKIPVTNTRGEFAGDLIRRLSARGLVLNITAMTDAKQVAAVAKVMTPGVPALISVFAGRVADAGRDPMPMMRECATILQNYPALELLWASTRETYNIFQAEQVGCRVITVPAKILQGLNKLGVSSEQLSLDTVKTFYRDALDAGYTLNALAQAPSQEG